MINFKKKLKNLNIHLNTFDYDNYKKKYHKKNKIQKHRFFKNIKIRHNSIILVHGQNIVVTPTLNPRSVIIHFKLFDAEKVKTSAMFSRR